MKPNKLLPLVTAFLLLVATLCSCGTGTVTYSTLSSDNQATIDYLYSKKSVWETHKDGTETNACTGAGFTTHNGTTVFKVSYLKSDPRNVCVGWVLLYEFDKNANRFEEVDATQTAYTGVNFSSGTAYTPTSLLDWDSSWNEIQQKNYLAQKYYAYLHK